MFCCALNIKSSFIVMLNEGTTVIEIFYPENNSPRVSNLRGVPQWSNLGPLPHLHK